MQVRVRISADGSQFFVETRGWFESFLRGYWSTVNYYDNLPRAMAVAEALKNPVIINIERKKS